MALLAWSWQRDEGGRLGGGARSANRSLARVGQERHEPGALDSVLNGALESGAVPAALAAHELALGRGQLLQDVNALVVHEGRPWAALLGAKTTAILPAPALLLHHHSSCRPSG